MSPETKLAKEFGQRFPFGCIESEDLPILAPLSGLNFCKNCEIAAGFHSGPVLLSVT
jgi:hypothetical protein